MFYKKYERAFYLQDTFQIAQKLLGSYLCTCIEGKLTVGKIVETEAYIGGIDKASHSYQGKRTERTEIQFGLGGYAYIFLIYGMYTQFCVVTREKDVSDVILIRAIEPVEGIDLIMQRRKMKDKKKLTNGPGKLCIGLGITKDFYGEDLLGDKIWISPPELENEINIKNIKLAKRIGIDYAEEFADKLWRFYIDGNEYVSNKDKNTLINKNDNLNKIAINHKDIERDTICLISWNVNGIRSIYKKGFLTWLYEYNPDILCLQETKAKEIQLTKELAKPKGYHTYWNHSSNKNGYSGTALLSKEKPLAIEYELGIDEFDSEGRTIIAEYPDFTLINCYFPNGGRDLSRLSFKMAFYDAFFQKCQQLRSQGKTIIICGDVNTAHQPIDLAHPKQNSNKTGFLPQERQWIDKLIESGYIDTFRHFHPNLTQQYTWWSIATKAREKNIGWRLDYFFVTEEAIKRVTDAFITPELMGSDHCPVGILLKLEIKRKIENEKQTDYSSESAYTQLTLSLFD